MRVIAGSARHLMLKTVEGLETRPTTDRIKETLFNMLQYELPDSVFLDLFSGSGAIGIEALSRGAKKAYFVENNTKAVKCIKENLQHTKLETSAVILDADVLGALRMLEKKEVFDFIFMDPPYNNEYEKQVLEYLKDSSIIKKETLIIVEAALNTPIEYAEELGFKIVKVKEYKTNKHLFLKQR